MLFRAALATSLQQQRTRLIRAAPTKNRAFLTLASVSTSAHSQTNIKIASTSNSSSSSSSATITTMTPRLRTSTEDETRAQLQTVRQNYGNGAVTKKQLRFLSAASTDSPQLKPWPIDVVESHGDYRAEAWLEDHIGGPLYEYQHQLPKLPIPSLTDTMAKLAPTMMPLTEKPGQAEELKELCANFPEQAKVLQQRLKERASGEYANSSYLQHWWNTLGYLAVRDSVVVNVSYFFHLQDDTTLSMGNGNTSTPRNVARAAAVLHAVAEFRLQVCSGAMAQESIGRPPKTTPLCSTAFKYMFNSCRIPHRDMDSYKMYDPSQCTHVIIARHNQFYSMDFVDANSQQPLPLKTLENGLQKIVQIADDNRTQMAFTSLDGQGPKPIGILTSQDRDSWADAREELLSVGGVTAAQAMKELESGAVLLCLDDASPVSRTECGQQFLFGQQSPLNRFYDKSIQIFVQENGKVGMLGEHSMMDGMPVVGLANHICNTTYGKVVAKEKHQQQGENISVPAVKDIFGQCHALWSASPKIQTMVDHASQKHQDVMDAQSLEAQAFQAYGSSHIKKLGYSPDAFVQMAIQLATFRLWEGTQGATYEATQTRPFLHGRTETTRSVSPASAHFCNVMGDYKYNSASSSSALAVSNTEKVAALQQAVKSHVVYIKGAAAGKGVDRHLLGLQLLVDQNEEAPALYSHPMYAKSKTWRVSTSHLSHPKFDNWGFGQVVPHGMGVGYGILPQKVVFNLTALKQYGWTSKLSHLLEEALLEMSALHDNSTGGAPPLKSKL